MERYEMTHDDLYDEIDGLEADLEIADKKIEDLEEKIEDSQGKIEELRIALEVAQDRIRKQMQSMKGDD